MNTSKRINNSVQKSTLPAWLWILYIIATPVIIFGGYIFYKIQHNQLIVNTESIGLTLLMLLALFTVPILIWKQSQHKYFRSLYLIEIEKKALNAHYEYLVKYANDMIILADGNMHIIEMNDRALEEYGYSRDEINSLTFDLLVAEEDISNYYNKFHELKSDQTSYLREGIHKRKDGSLFPVESAGRCIVIDDSQYFQSIIRNISERKVAEKNLQDSEELYRKLFENMLNGFAYCKMIDDPSSLDFVYIKVNQAFESSTGLKNVVGKKVSEVIPGIRETDKSLLEIYARVAGTGIPETFEMFVEGLKMWFMISVYSPGKGYFVAVFDVITERKRIELELLEKNEEIEAQNEEYQQINEELTQSNDELYLAKERAEESDHLKTAFLQNMSHEIRTPMNAIVGFSHLLYQNIYEPEQIKEFSKIISERSKDLLSIINEILEISRLETGQMSVSMEDCDINLVLDELYLFFMNYKSQIGKGHLHLEVKKMTDCESIIITDMVKFKQIFINLIQNALKNTTDGSIRFGFEAVEHGHLLFIVSDTGRGIPADKYSKIFERFTQIDVDPNAAKEGLGLGLSIVKGLVTILGGKIWLQSELNRGTSFHFSIPYRLGEFKKMKASPIELSVDQYSLWKNKTILIVEDDPSSREYFKEILGERTANLLFAETGLEAIDFVKSNGKIDLILMDIRLPDISGFEVTRRIKEMNNSIPVIAQTAYAMESDREKSIECGCDGFISKPIFTNELFSLISNKISTGNN